MKEVKRRFISLFLSFIVLCFFVRFTSGEVFALSSEAAKIFYISGVIDLKKDTGYLTPVFSFTTSEDETFNDLKKGEYSIELLDSNNSILLQQTFQPAELVPTVQAPKQTLYQKIINFLCQISIIRRFSIICPITPPTDLTSRTGSFSLRIPYTDGVTTIRLKHNSKLLDELKPGSGFPSVKINPVGVKQLPESGEFKLFWSSDDPDGDKIHYYVRVSYDNKKTWRSVSVGVPYPQLSWDVSRVPKSDSIFFQVLASDGINTSSDIVGPFSASVKMPVAQIIHPKDGDSIKEGWPIIFFGSGSSPEESNTIPDERLTWSSNISGILGNGQTLQIDKGLPKGKHIITLSVMDKYGNKDSASVNLIIN